MRPTQRHQLPFPDGTVVDLYHSPSSLPPGAPKGRIAVRAFHWFARLPAADPVGHWRALGMHHQPPDFDGLTSKHAFDQKYPVTHRFDAE